MTGTAKGAFERCPECTKPLKVIDSRAEDTHRMRRYSCPGCGCRQTSYEALADHPLDLAEATTRALLAELATRLQVRL